MSRTLPNHYETLGVGINATSDEIKSAFRQRAMETHPDRNKAPDAMGKFIALREAFEILSDAQKRRVYDSLRKPRHEEPSSSARPKTSGTSQSAQRESTSTGSWSSSTRQGPTSSSTSQGPSGRSSGPSSQGARPESKTREEEWRWYEIWVAEARKKGRETADTSFGDFAKVVKWMAGERAGARVAVAGRGCMTLFWLCGAFMFVVVGIAGEAWWMAFLLGPTALFGAYSCWQEGVAIKEKHLD